MSVYLSIYIIIINRITCFGIDYSSFPHILLNLIWNCRPFCCKVTSAPRWISCLFYFVFQFSRLIYLDEIFVFALHVFCIDLEFKHPARIFPFFFFFLVRYHLPFCCAVYIWMSRRLMIASSILSLMALVMAIVNLLARTVCRQRCQGVINKFAIAGAVFMLSAGECFWATGCWRQFPLLHDMTLQF